MKEIYEKLQKGILTPSQNLESKIKKIEEMEDKINAFITIDFENARKRAIEAHVIFIPSTAILSFTAITKP